MVSKDPFKNIVFLVNNKYGEDDSSDEVSCEEVNANNITQE